MSETDPINVHARGNQWLAYYGSYMQGCYDTPSEAIEVARVAALACGPRAYG